MSVAIILLLKDGCNQRAARQTAMGMYDAANSQLQYSRDSSEAFMLIIESKSEYDFQQIDSNDSLIQRLQNEVKNYRGLLATATVIGSRTIDNGQTTTTVITTPKDTAKAARNGDGAVVFPTYSSQWADKWSKGSIVARKDSIYRSITLFNEFVVTTGYHKRGLFKRAELEVTVANENPNTITTGLRSFRVKEKRGRFTISIHAGFGMNYGLLHQRIDVGPQIGVGGSFSIFP
jgi:hypothetical protein